MRLTLFAAMGLGLSAALPSRALAGEPMRFGWAGNGGNCASCSWIEAVGEITEDTPIAFEAFVKSQADKGFTLRNDMIVLDSPGGNVSAAVDLGEAFRRESVVTSVAETILPKPDPAIGPADQEYDLAAGHCLSACFFAFVGGRRRTLDLSTMLHPVTGSVIGIHRFALDQSRQSVVSAQQLSGMLSSYLSRMGIDPGILAVAASVPDTPPGNMHDLTHDEAVRFHVINMGLPPPAWSLQRGGGGQGLLAQLKGTAESDASAYNAWDYTADLACRDGADGPITLRMDISSDSPFPKQDSFYTNIPGSFTFWLGWQEDGVSYRGTAATSADPASIVQAFTPGTDGDGLRQVAPFDFTLASSAIQDGRMVLTFVLGPRSLDRIDTLQQISFFTGGKIHADQGWLPDEIPLPWQARENISKLLRNNCVGSDHD